MAAAANPRCQTPKLQVQGRCLARTCRVTMRESAVSGLTVLASASGAEVSFVSMKVLLPDRTELQLPDGATGLDAAKAIGPKLAEQAVLVRSNGHVRDLRLPLEDGEEIQILTTRDTSDPDALSVLRHSSAHLLAEAVRRLYPGVKVAIGPPIENGFYYDFEFPEPISEDDLAAHRRGDRQGARRGPQLDARGDLPRRGAAPASRPSRSRSRSSSSTPRKATSRSTRRATSPTSAAARTCRTRSRSRR